MQIRAYQFIKYNELTTIEHVEMVNETGAVICFDFEDGIVDPLNNVMPNNEKENSRLQFERLYSLIRQIQK